MRLDRATRGIGFYFVALILLAVVPLLVIAAVLVLRQTALQRDAFEKSLQQTSQALSVAVDRELASYRTMLETLAASQSLQVGDIAEFARIAGPVAAKHDAVFVSLFDPSGRQLFNSLRPAGDELPTPFADAAQPPDGARPPVGDTESIKRVLETGRAYNSDLFQGLVARRLVFTVNVPVMRDGAVAYVLNAGYAPDVMTRLLRENPQFQGVPAVIFDRRGFIVGRWQKSDEYVGHLVAPHELEHARIADFGVHAGATLEGIPLYYSFARSPVTGWSASIGVERAALEGNLRNGWILSGVLALGGLALGLALALSLASRLRRSIADLADAAARSRAPHVHGLRTREVAELERALTDAAYVRNAQAAERESRLIAEARKTEAEQANRAKDRFIAVLSHELRNPLAPIRNAVQLMRSARSRGMPPPPEVIDILDRQSDQLARLVSDLLDVARIDAGRIALHRKAMDVRGVARHAIDAVRPALDARGHRFVETLPAHPVYVDGDFARLAQVLTNLLDNAVKFTPAGGEISLAVDAAADAVTIRVRDSGRGIEATALERIFSPFHSGDDAGERLDGGLGLGLAVAKSLVELHGGTLHAESGGHDRGSEFVVRLPRIAALDDAAATATEPPLAASSTASRRVLVVDDNVDAARSAQALLDALGHRTRVAHNGAAALRAAAEFDPDVVLLDIGMPGMDGYEVAWRLRTQVKRPVTLVALTGWGQDADRARSKEVGFDVHLVKPVELDDLETALAHAPRAVS